MPQPVAPFALRALSRLTLPLLLLGTGTLVAAQPVAPLPGPSVAIDLDGDGAPEQVRDAASGSPFRACGLERAWVAPEVFDFASNRYRAVRVRPDASSVPRAATVPSEIADEVALAVPPRFASSDGVTAPAGGPGDPLSLATPQAGWSPSPADGAWIRIDVPYGFEPTRLVLDGPAATWLLAVDGDISRVDLDGGVAIALPASSRCVALQLAGAPPGATPLLRVARVETVADEVDDWFTDWAEPRLRAACAAGDAIDAAQTARAIAEARWDVYRYADLLGDPDPCVGHAAAEHLAQADPTDRDRMRWIGSDGIRAESVALLLETTHLSRGDWLDAAELSPPERRAVYLSAALAEPADGHAASLAIDLLWPPRRDHAVVTDRLLDGIDASLLPPLPSLPADVELARRALAVLARATPARTEWVQSLVDAALRRDDGSVARLGLAVASRFGAHGVTVDARALLDEDPSPELRAQALELLRDDEGAVLTALQEDASATVRLRAASLGPADDRLLAAIGAEAWPEVRQTALRRVLRAAEADAALAATLAAAAAEDVEALAPVLAVRDVPLPADYDVVVLREDVDAGALVRWLAALVRSPGDPARFVELHAGAEDASLRRAVLDGLAGAPVVATARAARSLDDPDDRVRATAVALTCAHGDDDARAALRSVEAGDAFPFTRAALDACEP